jgi:hypothetical protein
MVLVFALGLVSVGHAQMGGGMGGGTGGGMGGGTGGISGTAFGGATDPSNVQSRGGFQVIPSIAVAERYDSNVFFQAKVPGLDRSDYVTTVVPQIRGLYGGSAMTVNATVGANAEYYAKNTNFNYVGANSALSLDLSPMLNRLWEGMTVTVVDRFTYTPQPPSFLVGNQEGDTSNPFTRGQQVGRVSVTSNVVGTTVSAPLTQTLSLTGGYSYGFLRFGTSEVQQVGALLNSSYQTFKVGMSMQLSPQDSVSLSFLDSETRYEQAVGSFSSRGGTIGWAHLFSPNVTLASSAGAMVLQGQSSGLSNVPTTVVPQGRVALIWRDRTTSLSLAYGLAISPSYQFQAQPLLTNTVTFSVTQQTPIPQLVGVASVNYGRGDEIGSKSVNAVSYTSYVATGGVLYKFTPQTFLNLMYQYANYDNQFGATNNSFDRHVVSISLAQAFY